MIQKYTVQQWGEFEGLTEQETRHFYGQDVVAFYATEESPYAGCEHAGGSFDVFGCMVDLKGLTRQQMNTYLEQ